MEDNFIYLDELNEQSAPSGASVVYAPQDGKPGYRVKKADGTLGQWIPVDKSQLDSPGLKATQLRYERERLKRDEAESRAQAERLGDAAARETGVPRGQLPPTPKPEPAKPEPQKQPPKQSPVAQYMAAAAAARKSGDPVQMAKVRDQGMAIWRDKYKDTLAKKVDFESRPTGRSIGTGQSQMEKDAAELRAIRPAGKPGPDMGAAKPLQKVQAVSQPAATSLETQAQQQGVKPFDTSKLERSRVRKPASSTGMVSASYEYEPYDLVLEYLLSEGHAETVEEAHYVMMQMDAEYIQSIVEDSAPIPNIPSPVTKPKDKKPPTDGDKDRPLVPPGGFGDLSKPKDRTRLNDDGFPPEAYEKPKGGTSMGRGTPPNHDPNKYKKGKPTPGKGEVAPKLPDF